MTCDLSVYIYMYKINLFSIKKYSIDKIVFSHIVLYRNNALY